MANVRSRPVEAQQRLFPVLPVAQHTDEDPGFLEVGAHLDLGDGGQTDSRISQSAQNDFADGHSEHFADSAWSSGGSFHRNSISH